MEYTIEVQQFIDQIEELAPIGKKMKFLEKPVRYDFTEEKPIQLKSWRGSYSELTLDYGGKKELLVKDLLEDLKTCTNKQYRGYKGGLYRMNIDTEVWADAWGHYGERMIVGLEDTEDFVVIKTEIRKNSIK